MRLRAYGLGSRAPCTAVLKPFFHLTLPPLNQHQMNELGWGGLFPFEWRPEDGPHPAGKQFWRPSFEALKDKAFVPAVLQKLILDREPAKVLAFADAVARWPFTSIVPAHLGAPIAGFFPLHCVFV